jgi:hypothetical protein
MKLVNRKLQGRVEHECFIVPELNQDYKEILKGRHETLKKPKRSIQLLVNEGTIDANVLIPIVDKVTRVSRSSIVEMRKRAHE